MDDKKIEYLKKHLEQALTEDNYNDVNSTYQELLKLLGTTNIPDFTHRVNDYNMAHSEKHTQVVASSEEDIKKRIRDAKTKHNMNVKIEVIGLAGGLCAMLLGCLFVMCGGGGFGSYNDSIMYGGLAIGIVGGFMIFVGTIFAFIKNTSGIVLNTCRNEVFNLIVESEEKLKFLKNVETYENTYVGQVQSENRHGFGVGVYRDYVYVGEWKCGIKSGIGKLISDDMLMTLEGEFKEDKANGVVDIHWEDGNEWHGEYKNDLPWNGRGKTIVSGKIQEGFWQSGIKAQ